MKVKVDYEINIPESERVINIPDSDFDGLTQDESFELIFDKYVMPLIDAHLILSYDVLSNPFI